MQATEKRATKTPWMEGDKDEHYLQTHRKPEEVRKIIDLTWGSFFKGQNLLVFQEGKEDDDDDDDDDDENLNIWKSFFGRWDMLVP